MMYNLEAATAFVAWSRQQGVQRSYDGLGMLIEQAAEAFQLWRGVRPDTGGIAAWLRDN
jgi:shikimate dehydrogenase